MNEFGNCPYADQIGKESCAPMSHALDELNHVGKLLKKKQDENAALRALVREMGERGISGQGTLWFCGFCGNHGHLMIHYDDCILMRPEVKKIMEAQDETHP